MRRYRAGDSAAVEREILTRDDDYLSFRITYSARSKAGQSLLRLECKRKPLAVHVRIADTELSRAIMASGDRIASDGASTGGRMDDMAIEA